MPHCFISRGSDPGSISGAVAFLVSDSNPLVPVAGISISLAGTLPASQTVSLYCRQGRQGDIVVWDPKLIAHQVGSIHAQ